MGRATGQARRMHDPFTRALGSGRGNRGVEGRAGGVESPAARRELGRLLSLGRTGQYQPALDTLALVAREDAVPDSALLTQLRDDLAQQVVAAVDADPNVQAGVKGFVKDIR